MIKFKYYAPSGESEREIEAYYLIFKWSSWYVYGYCTLRNDFRMFKLNRMVDIVHTKDFEKGREVPMPKLENEVIYPREKHFKAIFDTNMKWQLIEDFGVDSFEELEDGRLLFDYEYSDDEGLIAWILSCGEKVSVLEPESIKEKLFSVTSKIAEKYRN